MSEVFLCPNQLTSLMSNSQDKLAKCFVEINDPSVVFPDPAGILGMCALFIFRNNSCGVLCICSALIDITQLCVSVFSVFHSFHRSVSMFSDALDVCGCHPRSYFLYLECF